MATTYTVQIAPMFWHDHIRRCNDRNEKIPTIAKGKRVEVELTGAELYDLYSDAKHYSTPSDFYPEMRPLCMSAKATVAAILKQVPNIDDLLAEYKAHVAAKRAAWLLTDEGKAATALAEKYQREYEEKLEHQRLHNPLLMELRGRTIKHPDTREMVEVKSCIYHYPKVILRLTDERIIEIDAVNTDYRVQEKGIEVQI